jgi:hypothetical protein
VGTGGWPFTFSKTNPGGSMKHFSLDPSMRATLGGAFYPTGYSMVMFPKRGRRDRIGHRLIDNGMSGDEVYLLPPQAVLAQITPTVEQADDPLPSAGTEGATVRAYTKLAREGHTACW